MKRIVSAAAVCAFTLASIMPAFAQHHHGGGGWGGGYHQYHGGGGWGGGYRQHYGGGWGPGAAIGLGVLGLALGGIMSAPPPETATCVAYGQPYWNGFQWLTPAQYVNC